MPKDYESINMFDKKLSLKAFTLSAGLVSAIGFGAIGLVAKINNALGFEATYSQVFIGFDLSGAGIFVGFIWGFLVGVIGGLIFAWTYNKML